MFKHAVRHPLKKARTDIRNNLDLTSLTLAAKLGRKDIFIECLELSHVVKIKCLVVNGEILNFFKGNLAIFEYQMLYISTSRY